MRGGMRLSMVIEWPGKVNPRSMATLSREGSNGRGRGDGFGVGRVPSEGIPVDYQMLMKCPPRGNLPGVWRCGWSRSLRGVNGPISHG